MIARRECSTLVVPGSNWKMLSKAAASSADATCIDLEDAVALDQKTHARELTIRALSELDFGTKVRQVRINALDSAYAYRDVIEIVEAAHQNLDVIIVPKVNTGSDLLFVDTLLTQIEVAVKSTRRIGLEALIETAQGRFNLAGIVAASKRLEGLIFGSGDYAASLGMPMASIGGMDDYDAQYPGHRWHDVMQAILVAARAHQLRAIDGPFADFKDEAGLAQACTIARALGFDGKWCIHPSQPDIVNAAFSPSPAEIDWARAVVAAYAQAQADGIGAVSVQGKMIDAANLRMCQMTLARVRAE
jgi:citrate lyase subunit beta/citryl-CoA lyase